MADGDGSADEVRRAKAREKGRQNRARQKLRRAEQSLAESDAVPAEGYRFANCRCVSRTPDEEAAYKAQRLEARRARSKGPYAERKRESAKAWREKNRDRLNAAGRDRYEEKRVEILIYQRGYYVDNGPRIRARVRKYAVENPEAKRAGEARRNARKRGVEGRVTKDEIRALAERQKYRCAYCRTLVRKGYHIDHIKPLAKGGLNVIANLQITCARCNGRKSAKDPEDFAREMGLLI
jgi:5-methylcytosine-specific restriction endonuclease McrA